MHEFPVYWQSNFGLQYWCTFHNILFLFLCVQQHFSFNMWKMRKCALGRIKKKQLISWNTILSDTNRHIHLFFILECAHHLSKWKNYSLYCRIIWELSWIISVSVDRPYHTNQILSPRSSHIRVRFIYWVSSRNWWEQLSPLAPYPLLRNAVGTYLSNEM